MRKLIFLIGLFFQILHGEEQHITEAKSQFLTPTAYENIINIDKYLQNFVNKKATDALLLEAQSFLKSQYFISKSLCEYDKEKLLCKIETHKTIKQILVNNLPSVLLLSELKRRLPVSLGQIIPKNINERERFKKNISNITEKFLVNNGFYDALIEVSFVDTKEEYLANLVIDIKNGHFVYVNKVEVIGDSPINKKTIARAYKTMCLSPTRWINALGLRSFACYAKSLEDETTKALEEKMALMGFVENRLRISRNQVGSRINLRVEVENGPKVVWHFRVVDNTYVERGFLSKILSKIFFVDNLKRVVKGEDEPIIKSDLNDQVTIIQFKSVDDNELRSSQQALQNLLIEKGYLYAQVSYFINKDKFDNIKIVFLITTNKKYFIKQVSLNPGSFYEYIDKSSLNKIIPTKSWFNSGHLLPNSIEDAKKFIVDSLKAKGFSDIFINSDLVTNDEGEVTVDFDIETNERKILNDLNIINGISELNDKIIFNLANCDNHAPLCKGSSLNKDEIENDKIKLIDYYKNQGYLYIDIQSELLEDENGYHLNFYLFDKRFGPRNNKKLIKQNIKDIIISGNDNTNSDVIKRLFKKNDATPKDLKLGIGSLKETGIFSSINNKILAAYHNSDDVYFLIQVVEEPTLFLNTALAFSTDRLFSIEAQLEEYNLFSSMLKLDTSLSLGLFWGRQSSFKNKIIWPKILGSNFRLTIDAPSLIYKDELHLSSPKRELEGKIGVTLEMPPFLGLRPFIGYNLRFNQKEEFKEASRSTLKKSLENLDGLLDVLKLKANARGIFSMGLNFNALDNPFEPRLGVDLDVALELGGGIFYGPTPFAVFLTKNSFYLPMGPFTWALKLDFARGFITPSEENWKEISSGKSIGMLGGDLTLRGYEEKAIGMIDQSYPKNSGAGYFLQNAKVELRFPLSFGKELSNFSGALLMDEGLLTPCRGFFDCVMDQSLLSTKKDHRGLGLSLGAALRYSLPVGVISVEYAFSLLHSDKKLHILLGYVF